MFKLIGQDGKEVFVETSTDKKEYIASGFYSEKSPEIKKPEKINKVEKVEDVASEVSESSIKNFVSKFNSKPKKKKK